MPLPSMFKQLSIGPHQLSFFLQGKTALVEFENQSYAHLWFLVQQLPLLSDSLFLREFAQVSNFFWKGAEFEFIESITDYQNHYIQQVELEKRYPSDVFPYRLTDFKIFDVSVMHDPLLDLGQLMYFVYHTENGLPYRVVCPFPYTSASTLVHYQILPFRDYTTL